MNRPQTGRRRSRSAVRSGRGILAAAIVGVTALGLSLLLVEVVPTVPSAIAGSATRSVARSERAPEIPATPLPSPGGPGTTASSGAANRGLTSANWAGYIDTGVTFSSVSGSWVQPSASCPLNQTQQAAFWVGIGGFVQRDTTIEQVGTDSDCVKGRGRSSGVPYYYAWYQMFPRSLVVLPSSSFPLAPGQTLQASVVLSGADRYTLTITDVGHWTFSTVQSQASQPPDASAEWIAEAPTVCKPSGKCKVLPLPDFGRVTFTSAAENGRAISRPGLTTTAVTMTKKRIVKATPSALAGGGTSFGVTWSHS